MFVCGLIAIKDKNGESALTEKIDRRNCQLNNNPARISALLEDQSQSSNEP